MSISNILSRKKEMSIKFVAPQHPPWISFRGLRTPLHPLSKSTPVIYPPRPPPLAGPGYRTL